MDDEVTKDEDWQAIALNEIKMRLAARRTIERVRVAAYIYLPPTWGDVILAAINLPSVEPGEYMAYKIGEGNYDFSSN